MKYIAIVAALITATSLSFGNQISQDQQKYIEKYKNHKLLVGPADASINTCSEPDLTSGFVDLFNGKDLTGWTPRGGHCTFEVRDEVIVGTNVPGSPSTYLSTDREDYGDFVFSAELKWEVDGNSGVMFRANRRPGKGGIESVFGPQAEMEGFAMGRGWSGGIYGQAAKGWRYPLWLDAHAETRKALKKGEWNRITIEAKGDTVKTWINGQPAANWINDEFKQGFFGLQVHSGKKGTILFRNLKIKELTAN